MENYKLKKILTPPENPYESDPDFNWPTIDSSITFPSDYSKFIENYGSGIIDSFFVIFNPFSKNENINFFNQKKIIIDSFLSLKNEDPSYFKFKLYPEPNGLLPVGVTENSDYIFWVVSDISNSEKWGTAIIASRSPDVEYFNENITSLLSGILTGEIKSNSLPRSIPSKNVAFEKIS